MFRNVFSVCLLLCFQACNLANNLSAYQDSDATWQWQTSGSQASFRGLSAVSQTVAWVSGSGGTVLKTVDGGESWNDVSPSNTAELDFRDIEAFDAKTAVILSAGTPSRVYRTEDGGESWKLVFEHKDERAFFDAMDFSGDSGIAFSDPIDGRLVLIESNDRGRTWNELPMEQRPPVAEGEAGFAASGTCLIIHNDQIWVGLGGKHDHDSARLLNREIQGTEWQKIMTPMVSNESSGIFSIAFADEKNAVVVGGNYAEDDDVSSNIAISQDGGTTWQSVDDEKAPRGYRSCVRFLDSKGGNAVAISVGTNGSDVSFDYGHNWFPLSDEGLHTLDVADDGTVWAAGGDGKIARLNQAAVERLRPRSK